MTGLSLVQMLREAERPVRCIPVGPNDELLTGKFKAVEWNENETSMEFPSLSHWGVVKGVAFVDRHDEYLLTIYFERGPVYVEGTDTLILSFEEAEFLLSDG